MREEAGVTNDQERMQMWAGQAARYAEAEGATTLVPTLWKDALTRLRCGPC
jgi:hypothetical protein